jgi:hypothetical protein
MVKESIGHVRKSPDISRQARSARSNSIRKHVHPKEPSVIEPKRVLSLLKEHGSKCGRDRDDERILAKLQMRERALSTHLDSLETLAGVLYDLNIGLGFDPRTLWGDDLMNDDIEGARQRLSEGRNCIVRAWERASQEVWQWEQWKRQAQQS